jgi:serine/threonine-protein kinase
MVRKDFWKSDWFLGVIVALVVFLLSGTDLLKSLERKAYDLGVRASSRAPSERVAVIAIDDISIANIGRWPLAARRACAIDRPPRSSARPKSSATPFSSPSRRPIPRFPTSTS